MASVRREGRSSWASQVGRGLVTVGDYDQFRLDYTWSYNGSSRGNLDSIRMDEDARYETTADAGAVGLHLKDAVRVGWVRLVARAARLE